MSQNTSQKKTPDMADVDVFTIGCRLNTAESQAIKKTMEDVGLSSTLVLNTCAVTNEAVRQSRQMARKLKRLYPSHRLLVTGCATQVERENFEKMPEIDGIINNHNKTDASSFTIHRTPAPSPFTQKTATSASLSASTPVRPRAFVDIQNGCDHRCTFCIIPYARGPARSTPPDEVVKKIQDLVEKGTQEVILTGVDLTSYGIEWSQEECLGGLVEKILKETSLARLRLSSLDVAEIDATLFKHLATHPRLMPCIHLSLQSGAMLILKRMKRRHTPTQAVSFCRRLLKERPEYVFGADLIAGFPTETEDHFQESIGIIDACPLTWLHIFPFSPKAGTPAARMPQVPQKIIKHRAKILRNIAKIRKETYLRGVVGRSFDVLMETEYRGLTPQFAPFYSKKALRVGEICHLEARAMSPDRLLG